MPGGCGRDSSVSLVSVVLFKTSFVMQILFNTLISSMADELLQMMTVEVLANLPLTTSPRHTNTYSSKTCTCFTLLDFKCDFIFQYSISSLRDSDKLNNHKYIYNIIIVSPPLLTKTMFECKNEA